MAHSCAAPIARAESGTRFSSSSTTWDGQLVGWDDRLVGQLAGRSVVWLVGWLVGRGPVLCAESASNLSSGPHPPLELDWTFHDIVLYIISISHFILYRNFPHSQYSTYRGEQVGQAIVGRLELVQLSAQARGNHHGVLLPLPRPRPAPPAAAVA